MSLDDSGVANAGGRSPGTGPSEDGGTDKATAGEPAHTASEPAQQVTNYNVWLGSYASGSTNFGMDNGVATPRRSRTGPLLESDVETTLRSYVRPEPFAEALATLRARHLVILQGTEGLGKRAGAIALLHECQMEGVPIGLPPTTTLEELGRHTFRGDHGYLVQDRVDDKEEAEVAAFDVQELERALVRANAFLVITTHARTPLLRDLKVSWDAPAPLRLLRRALMQVGREMPEGLLATRINERFATCRMPQEIIDFVARLDAAGEDPDAALHALDASEARPVRAWFERKPSQEAIVFATALAFLHGLPERQFDEAREDLERRVRDAQVRSLGEGVQRAVVKEPALEPERERRLRQVPLAVRDSSRPGLEGTLVFETDLYRRRVLAELWARYDHSLWKPVREWLDAITGTLDGTGMLSVALGLALLGHVAAGEMRVSYLEEWAAGTDVERAVACYAIWFASVSDELGPLALGIAVDWARSSEDRRVDTAIACLSGELGLRYPGEAMRWLWHLEGASAASRSRAAAAIAELFVAGVTAGEGALRVPMWLLARLEREPLLGGPGSPRRRLLSVVGLLLAIRSSRGPAVVELLICEEKASTTLGPLWAACLHNAPSRGRALSALRDTLWTLGDDPDVGAVVARLGAAITSLLSATEVALLERDLYRLLVRRRDTDAGAARSIVDALLASRASEPNTPPKGY